MRAIKQYRVGSEVLVRLYDGRKFKATVSAISETVAGRKVEVSLQHMALRLDAAQIVKVFK